MRQRKRHARYPAPHPKIQVIQRAGMHPHQHVVRPHMQLRHFRVMQHRRITMLVNHHCFHNCPPECNSTRVPDSIASRYALRAGRRMTSCKSRDWRKKVCAAKVCQLQKIGKRASANRLAGRITARWFASGDLSPVSPRSLPQRALARPPACYRGSRATSLQLSGASKDGCSIETSVRPSPGP